MDFKLWFEEKQLFQGIKNALRGEILSTLDPNEDQSQVVAKRITDYKDQHGVLSGSHYLIKLFDKNHKIWEMMNKAFPGEVDKSNQIKDWLLHSHPNDTINDLFQQIGISGNPMAINKPVKSRSEKMPVPKNPTPPPINQMQQPVQGQVPSATGMAL